MLRWRSPSITSRSMLRGSIMKIGSNWSMLIYDDVVEHAVIKSKPDYVFRLAAQSYPRTSFDSPLDTLDTNVQGTERLLGALRKYAKDAVIHVCASSEVFGRVPKDKLPIDEECTFHLRTLRHFGGTDLIWPLLCRGL